MVDANLLAVRAAVEQAKGIAAVFHTATASFYVSGNPTPVMVVECRVKKPRPSSFDASNSTEWATKRALILKVPMDLPNGINIIEKGWVVQIATPDGDPTINHVNFVVQSALTSQFAAEREVSVITEVTETPRVP